MRQDLISEGGARNPTHLETFHVYHVFKYTYLLEQITQSVSILLGGRTDQGKKVLGDGREGETNPGVWRNGEGETDHWRYEAVKADFEAMILGPVEIWREQESVVCEV